MLASRSDCFTTLTPLRVRLTTSGCSEIIAAAGADAEMGAVGCCGGGAGGFWAKRSAGARTTPTLRSRELKARLLSCRLPAAGCEAAPRL